MVGLFNPHTFKLQNSSLSPVHDSAPSLSSSPTQFQNLRKIPQIKLSNSKLVALELRSLYISLLCRRCCRATAHRWPHASAPSHPPSAALLLLDLGAGPTPPSSEAPSGSAQRCCCSYFDHRPDVSNCRQRCLVCCRRLSYPRYLGRESLRFKLSSISLPCTI